ncbi:MAG TPA: hypothetical protein VE379_06320, partial [Vicinamibacterales bacterium]|nr:hypothetical protein [Vicinamibacterales bacterium]
MEPRFTLGRAVTATRIAERYQTVKTDPPQRRLKVFTQDPATSRFDAAVADVGLPFEHLEAGPTGQLFEIVDYNETRRETYRPVELDTVDLALRGGLTPSTTDPRFAQQMTYALASATYDRFFRALGRHPSFGFDAAPGEPHVRLKIRPHARMEENAWYDPDLRELAFGYFKAGPESRWKTQPGDLVYTALSHDVVVHEMSHALLDGMRAQFLVPTNEDVSAFHEGFADLVAVFQRFSHAELVRHAMGRAKGQLTSHLLTEMARQFGQTASDGDGRTALRTAILDTGGPEDDVLKKFRYEHSTEEHDRGAVLVTAVFEAFRRVFDRKTERFRKIAGPGEPSAALIDVLADEARDLAGQFLNVIIRAVDYCPPVDITFGEYLRALITADADVVPADPWGYREALVLAFRRYGVTVPHVPDLSEDALLWRSPEQSIPPLQALAYNHLAHARRPEGDPGVDERKRRAEAIGKMVTLPEQTQCFGLSSNGG